MADSPSRIFRSATTNRALQNSYFQKVHESSTRGKDGIPGKDLEAELRLLLPRMSHRLRSGTYTFTSYRELLKSKGAGKNPRRISIATARDRIALASLSSVLRGVFPESSGRVPQAVLGDALKAFRSGDYSHVARIDIVNFFPSILHGAVEDGLRRRVQKTEIISVIMAAISTPTVPDRARKVTTRSSLGVPQGLAISNSLAEIVLGPLDKELRDLQNLSSHRFVDDLLIFTTSQEQAEDVIVRTQNAVATLGLTCHPVGEPGGKTYIQKTSDEFDFLGYVFRNSGLGIRKSSLDNVRSSLVRLFTAYRKRDKTSPEKADLALGELEWRLNLLMSGCIFEEQRRGFVFYFSQTTELHQMKALDHHLASLKNRFAVAGLKTGSFHQSFWNVKHSRSAGLRNIPNFDKFSTEQKKQTLEVAFPGSLPTKPSNSLINALFRKHIKQATELMDKDVGALS